MKQIRTYYTKQFRVPRLKIHSCSIHLLQEPHKRTVYTCVRSLLTVGGILKHIASYESRLVQHAELRTRQMSSHKMSLTYKRSVSFGNIVGRYLQRLTHGRCFSHIHTQTNCADISYTFMSSDHNAASRVTWCHKLGHAQKCLIPSYNIVVLVWFFN